MPYKSIFPNKGRVTVQGVNGHNYEITNQCWTGVTGKIYRQWRCTIFVEGQMVHGHGTTAYRAIECAEKCVTAAAAAAAHVSAPELLPLPYPRKPMVPPVPPVPPLSGLETGLPKQEREVINIPGIGLCSMYVYRQNTGVNGPETWTANVVIGHAYYPGVGPTRAHAITEAIENAFNKRVRAAVESEGQS